MYIIYLVDIGGRHVYLQFISSCYPWLYVVVLFPDWFSSCHLALPVPKAPKNKRHAAATATTTNPPLKPTIPIPLPPCVSALAEFPFVGDYLRNGITDNQCKYVAKDPPQKKVNGQQLIRSLYNTSTSLDSPPPLLSISLHPLLVHNARFPWMVASTSMDINHYFSPTSWIDPPLRRPCHGHCLWYHSPTHPAQEGTKVQRLARVCS